MIFIGALAMFAFAALGRWVQLHPEKLTLQGTFEGPQSSGATGFRGLIGIVGTFAVFGGVWFGIASLFFWSSSVVLFWLVQIAAIVVGVIAARRVRREVREKYLPTPGQFGLWP